MRKGKLASNTKRKIKKIKEILTMATFNGYVRGGALNLRASCSTGATKLASIPDGTALQVSTVDGQNEWFATSYAGYSGFVVAEFVAITEDGGTCQVTTVSGGLNVRKKPVSGATRIFLAPQNSILRLLDYTSVSGWYRVSDSNGTGWAQSQFLTILSYPNGNTPTPDPDPDPSGDTIPAPDTVITEDLAFDSSNAQVIPLQAHLNQLGYYCEISTKFDYYTLWAVKYFQQRNNLTVTGIVDANTRAKLNAYGVSCGTKRGVDDAIRYWRVNQTPQQWYMNGSAQLWRNEPFNAANTSQVETIGDSGNCPTSFAMIASTLRGMAITPPIVCNYVQENGLRDENGNTGVTSDFFEAAALKYGLRYHGRVSGIANIKNYVQNFSYLALVRVVANSAHSYCGGATYLVVYKVDGLVYVMNPNYNTRTQVNLSESAWNASWVKEAHLYSL